eukprot:scaffold392_cov234-Pinguiococcus_pyrenoidosus.AAC.4
MAMFVALQKLVNMCTRMGMCRSGMKPWPLSVCTTCAQPRKPKYCKNVTNADSRRLNSRTTTSSFGVREAESAASVLRFTRFPLGIRRPIF